jgi:hypothetical protein
MNCSNEEQALEVRHNFAQTLQPQITSVIERLCTQHVSDKEWLQIDTIEVDMGLMAPEEFGRDFEKIFLHKFEKELLAKLSVIPARQRIDSVKHARLELVTHFLLTGILPWWVDETAIQADDVYNEVFAHSVAQVVHFFLQQKSNTIVWKRAAYQLNEQARCSLVEHIGQLTQAKKLLSELLAALIKQVNGLHHEWQAAEPGLLEYQSEIRHILERHTAGLTALVIEYAPEIFTAGNNQLQVKQIGIEAIARSFGTHTAALQLLQKAYSYVVETAQTQQHIADIHHGSNMPGKTAGNLINEVNMYGSSFNNSSAVPAAYQQPQNEADDIIVEKLIAKHAGIILLAPFLTPFFTNLHLLEAGQWINREAQVKAVYLLKYLADGGQQHPEYQLVLEKLLCGIPINQPLEPAPVFSQAETDEAMSLLQSVITHWKQLKHTSAKGLRESFFLRDGIITKKENNWLLQVERKTVDVLLDSIPWGFSTMSFSWNEYIIFTEW